MTPEEVVNAIGQHKASAILRTKDADVAEPAMEAAVRAGFRVIEFTLTTPNAYALIEKFSKRDELIVGAGTVMTLQQAMAAINAGARYLVSPIVDETIIDAANSFDVPMMPGTHTPTEMMRAHRAGAHLIKLFPAPGTGPAFVKATLGPLPFLRIVPTNGVTADNAAAFLQAGAFAVGFVAPVFDSADLAAHNCDAIEQRATTVLRAVAEA